MLLPYHKTKIKLIVFDAFDTLFTLRSSVGELYITYYQDQIRQHRGTFRLSNLSVEAINYNFKRAFKENSKQYPNFGFGSIGYQEYWKRIVTQSYLGPHRNDIKYEKEKSLVQNLIFPDLFNAFGRADMYQITPTLTDTFQFLKQRHPHITLGVLSNYDPRLHSILSSIKLTPFFNFVLTSYEMGVMKPDSRIFDMTLSHVLSQRQEAKVKNEDLQILPREALYIGNTPKVDYLGANQSGWNALLYDSTGGNRISTDKRDTDGIVPKEHMITSMNEILNYLQ